MKIMVCYTGSTSSRQALELALWHAKVFNAKLYLVASMKKATAEEQEDVNHMEEALQEALEKLQTDGIDCETRLLVRGFSAGEDLVHYAGEENVDEIIIGIRKRSKTGKRIFGSIAQHIILNAPCPVVTVK